MTREMKAFIILVVSLILFVLTLPATLLISVLRVVKGTCNVLDKSLTFFVQALREEIIK